VALRWKLGVHVVTRFVTIVDNAHRFCDLIILVVAGENDDGRVVSESLDHFFSFILDIGV
jgi:hypothetical protein